MKSKKKYLENNQAISSFLSVMIFAAITILLVIVVWILHSGIFNDVPQRFIPSIGLIQERDYILITGVQNGPVLNNSVTVEIVNKSSGQAEGSPYINDGGNGEINVGDSIALVGITKGVYTISIIYEEIVVGHCQYSIYKD